MFRVHCIGRTENMYLSFINILSCKISSLNMYLRSENARSDEYRHWRRRGMPRIGQLAGIVSENANYLHTPTLAKQGSHSLQSGYAGNRNRVTGMKT